MTQVRVVGENRDNLGEGPVWSAGEHALWWVDINAPALRRLDAVTGALLSMPLPASVGSFALRRGGGLLLALRHRLSFYDPATGTITPATPAQDEDADMRFNDGRCDRQGRFWVGTMGETHRTDRGRLYRLDASAALRVFLDGVTIPNGLAFSPDGRTMYFADSTPRTIWAYAYNPQTGTPGERRVFATVPAPGVPDGAIVDAEGCLWSAEYGNARITRYTPDGRIQRQIALPVAYPTCPAFGGPDLATLYITSASQEANPSPADGALLACVPGPRGLPEPAFAG